MNFPLRSTLAPALVAASLALGAGAGCTRVVPAPSSAQVMADTITVIGRGEVSRAPDIAQTTLGVEITAASVQDATRLANQRMNEVLAALEKAGIDKSDIQTRHLNVGFERTYPPPRPMPAPDAATDAAPQPERPAGFYRVTNMVEVKIRDLEKVGPVLDAAIGAGANAAYGISFSVENPETLEAEARAKAVEQARAQAEQLAKLAGHSLGEVVAMTAEFMGGPIRPMVMMAKEASYAYDGGTPVSAGEVSVSAQVQVIYRIAR